MIIYIDDDLDDLSIFYEVITTISPSYQLETFSDAIVALDFLKETTLKPIIIFLDNNMPRLNGKETLSAIRKMKDISDVPVVIYSTTIQKEEKKIFMELGASDFLQKPNSFGEMVREVDLILKQFLNKA